MIPSAAWRFWRLNDPCSSECDSDTAAMAAAKTANAFEWPVQPPKIAPPLGDLHPHQIHGSMVQPESSSKTACWSDQLFLHTHSRVSHYFTMGHCIFPQILPLPLGGSSSHVTHSTKGLQLIEPNDNSIGSAVFVWVPNAMHCCTMHCQWERKPPKLPLPLGTASPRRKTEACR